MKVASAGICIYCSPLIESVTVFGCELCGAHMCLKCNPHGNLCPLCIKCGPPIPQLPLRNPDDPARRPKQNTDTALILSNFFPSDPKLLAEVPTMPAQCIANAARVKKTLLQIKQRSRELREIREMSPAG